LPPVTCALAREFAPPDSAKTAHTHGKDSGRRGYWRTILRVTRDTAEQGYI